MLARDPVFIAWLVSKAPHNVGPNDFELSQTHFHQVRHRNPHDGKDGGRGSLTKCARVLHFLWLQDGGRIKFVACHVTGRLHDGTLGAADHSISAALAGNNNK